MFKYSHVIQIIDNAISIYNVISLLHCIRLIYIYIQYLKTSSLLTKLAYGLKMTQVKVLKREQVEYKENPCFTY